MKFYTTLRSQKVTWNMRIFISIRVEIYTLQKPRSKPMANLVNDVE